MTTPHQITRHLARTGASLFVHMSMVKQLRQAADDAAAHLPVRWTFAPGTPADLVDYLGGVVSGGVQGAILGLAAAIVFPPAAGYLVAGGAFLGAVRGVRRVEQGWRLELVYSYDGTPWLSVRRVA